ncbi:hypothetical protein NADFUDRAFT_82035 [Nadsonia fulvescens var. elongata DSM 6958]|uniref:Uncharacterized protein n=1 Tax=Nadsonia fulvescens var. elongata DSM 6958 TaxID=857566 RepID=A0A1E3PQ86_9ASCO|nr:hypothetical protein NADFUDRAFT_82035 [Nadsonia fulvescens var. elongata DSM 6958]
MTQKMYNFIQSLFIWITIFDPQSQYARHQVSFISSQIKALTQMSMLRIIHIGEPQGKVEKNSLQYFTSEIRTRFK